MASVPLTEAQDKPFAFLTGYYGDCRADDQGGVLDTSKLIRLVGIDEDGDERCRWLVRPDGSIESAWDPDCALDAYKGRP